MALKLRARFTITLLALALVPLVVTMAILIALNLDRLRRTTKEYHLAVADSIATRIRADLRQARSELGALGATLARTDLTAETRLLLAESLLLGAQSFDAVTLYDQSGRLVDTLRAATDKPSVAPLPSLDEGTRGVARTEGVAYLSPVRSQDASIQVPILLPIYAGSKPKLYGYVGASISLEPIRRNLITESKRRFHGAEDRIWIVDQKLRIIAHAKQDKIFQNVAGKGIFADMENPGRLLTKDLAVSEDYASNGRPVLGVLQPLPELGWGIVVEQPRAEAYATIRTTLATALVVGGTFALFALLLGLFMGKHMAAPILSVSEAAHAVANGDFSKRVSTKRKDEVGQMAESFNSMAADLERFEARVVEETRIRTDLARYLSADLVEGVIHQEIDLALGGQRQHVVVLFADIVAFTPLVEQHPAEDVVSVLNELFTFLTEIIFRQGGMVDKFIGDSVMAVFNVPKPQSDPELRAVRAAEEMLRWLDTGNVRWKQRLGRKLELAIGINAGKAVVGNVGSARRMEYTVIGDAVNVAARLESIARPGQVLMTEAVARAVTDEFETERLGPRQLAGKAEPVEIYSLADL